MTTKTTEPLQESLTNLRALEIMRDHCISQGEPCYEQIHGLTMDGELCVYRNGDGLRCAFGALMPDNRIEDIMVNNEEVSSILATEVEMGETWCINLTEDLILEAQDIHDNTRKKDGEWVSQITTKFNALIHRVQNGEFATGE